MRRIELLEYILRTATNLTAPRLVSDHEDKGAA
jgi:hypothetical protein